MFLTKQRIVCWILVLSIILLSCIQYIMQPKTDRVILFFQTKNGMVKNEERYIPRSLTKEPIISLVDELLLGPMNHTFLQHTDPDIRANSCFVRNDCLYLDLPKAVLTPKTETVNLSVFYELLKRTIFTNYSHIHTIAFSIDGKPAYEKDRVLRR